MIHSAAGAELGAPARRARDGFHEVPGEMAQARGHALFLQYTLALSVALVSCRGAATGSERAVPEGAPLPPAARAAPAAVLPGVDVLLQEQLDVLRGKGVGLITNHTGKSAAGESTIDLLWRQPGVKLVALFGPEHGIRGEAQAGVKVAHGVDAKTRLPVYSLYSGAEREPTAEQLAGIDVLVFDIQDIGARYYTYVWTMARSMAAAAKHGLRFVVLDRPNPIGGALVQGNVLERGFESFVGLYPVPMRHGMTTGEMARYINEEHGVGADLVVVPMRGWRRSFWYEDTGLPWVRPSPNMPSVESAAHYPGACLFEGTNLSVGRGTEQAFQQIGAPWLDHEELARRLNGYALPGVRFEPVTFPAVSPERQTHAGEKVPGERRGVRFIATDRQVYDPTLAAVAALVEIRRLHPREFEWAASFDRLAGGTRLREQISAGASLQEIVGAWRQQLEEFSRIRERYLIYR